MATHTMDFAGQDVMRAAAYPAYGNCDSYFVESHEDDDGVFARAAAERERARAVSKMRQRALAEELSQITADEYLEDVLDHMERMESETMPDIQSIEIQTEIQWFMRPYLLDFLLEAHHAFQLLPETMHLAVNLLDRYCSRRVVYKRHYQLVGCAALLIAAKYGDRKERVPTIRELKGMCCSMYEEDMFTQMEWHILHTLNWIIGHPTVTSFLQLAMTDVSFDPELEHMSWYITELALYHKDFIPVRPSIMARSALALARCVLDRPQPRYQDWSVQYDSQIVLGISNYLSMPSPALRRKYSSPHLSQVSSTVDIFLARQAALAQRAAAAAAAAARPIDHLQEMDVETTSPASVQLLTPQTPQKGGWPAPPYGVLTPPITPDKDQCVATYNGTTETYAAAHYLVPRLPPSTPTPPSSVPQEVPQLHYPPAPQSYAPQPHFQ